MSAGFVEGSIMGVTAAYPAQENPPIIYFNSEADASSNTWHTATVPNAPSDIKAVFLWGLLIITNGNSAIWPNCVTADIHMYFKAPNAVPTPPLTIIDCMGQACQEGFGGERSGCAGWVPVVNNQFQWWWYRSTSEADHPEITYGCKMYVNGYIR